MSMHVGKGATKHPFAERLQTEHDAFMDIGDVEKIDMILESPQGAFKGNFDQNSVRPVNYRVLGTLGMVTITYMYTCGGPIGSEPIVQSGGPLIAMTSLILYPLLVAIPYAYIIAELCSAFPEDGGFTIWVLNAFGPFWAFQVGYWSWISGVIRSALAPGVILTLFCGYLDKPEPENLAVAWLIKAGTGLVLALPALFGTIPVSRLSTLLLVLVVIPFLTYTVWAYTTAHDFDDLFEIRHEHDTYNEATADVESDGPVAVDWDTLINVLFYKFDGIYMASVFGGEVMNPARTYPRAILFTLVLTIATYLVPLPASILADDLTWLKFDRDAYPIMAEALGGSFLKTFILIASVAGAAGTFTAGIFVKGFMVSGMAANRLLPVGLARRSARYEAPTNAVLVTTVCAIALSAVEFDDLLSLGTAFASVVQFMIIIAAMRLRMTLPYIPRPTKVPGGVVGLMVLATIPAAVLGYIVLDLFLDSLVASLLLVGLTLVGLAYGFWAARWH